MGDFESVVTGRRTPLNPAVSSETAQAETSNRAVFRRTLRSVSPDISPDRQHAMLVFAVASQRGVV
jgi:hypothetical protein